MCTYWLSGEDATPNTDGTNEGIVALFLCHACNFSIRPADRDIKIVGWVVLGHRMRRTNPSGAPGVMLLYYPAHQIESIICV